MFTINKKNNTLKYVLILFLILIFIGEVRGALSDNVLISSSFENANTNISDRGINATITAGTTSITTQSWVGNRSIKIASASSNQGLWFPYQVNRDTDLTICAMVNITGSPGACTGTGVDGNIYQLTNAGSSGRVYVSICSGSVGLSYCQNTACWTGSTYVNQIAYTANQYKELCFVMDYTSSTNTNYSLIYNNTKLTTTSNYLYDNAYTAGISVGAQGAGFTANAETFVDCFNVWNKALNNSEIAEWKNSCIYPYTSPPVSTIANVSFRLANVYNISFYVNNYSLVFNNNGTTYSTTNGTIALLNYNISVPINISVLNATNHYDINFTDYTIASANVVLTATNILNFTNATILSPTSQNYAFNESLLINFSAPQSYINQSITSYNISLLNSDLTYNKTINGTTTSLQQYFNLAGLSAGAYRIRIEAKSLNLTASTISNEFNITSLITIKLKNAYTNNYETNFTGWVYNNGYNQTFNSGTSNTSVVNVLPGTNQIYVERINYSVSSSNYYNVTSSSTITNVTFSLYTENSIYILIKDETTANLITQSITLELQYLNATIGNYNTTSGIIFLDELADGEYTLLFVGDTGVNYTARTYIVSVAEKSTQTLNAYLTSSVDNVIIKTADAFSQQVIESATISLYKSINNTLTLIEIKDTDITGRAQFSFIPSTKYRFIIQKAGYITKSFDLNPILFSSYDVLLDRQIVYTFTGSQEDVKITWSPQQYFANETTNFTMIFSSATGVLNRYGVNISAPCLSYNFSGNNSIGQTFQQNFVTNCSHFRDTINITYFYTSVGNDEKVYHVQYFISGTYSSSPYTWINMRNNHFGMGLLERIFIVVLLALVVGGTAYLMVGGIGALLLSLFVYAYFVSTGFIPLWSVVISLISGIFLMLGGKD